MKKVFFFILPICLVLGFVIANEPAPFKKIISLQIGDSTGILQPKPEHMKEAALIAAILNQHHYSNIKLDDSLSSVIFDEYIESYDNYHIYFTKGDIAKLEKYRYELDDLLFNGDVSFAYETFAIFHVPNRNLPAHSSKGGFP